MSMNTPDSIIETHFRNAASYASLYEIDGPLSFFFRTRLRHVDRLLGDCRGMRILDAGSGPGMVAAILQRRGCHYVAVDRSLAMVTECWRRFGALGYVSVSAGRMQQLPYRAASFDVVLCLGALEYLQTPERAIAEFARVLRPGGTMILSMLNPYSPYRIVRHRVYRSAVANRIKKAFDIPVVYEPPLYMVSESRLAQHLVRSRLAPVESVYFDWNLLVPPLEAKLPAHIRQLWHLLEPLSQTSLRRLCTGYIVKARKIA